MTPRILVAWGALVAGFACSTAVVESDESNPSSGAGKGASVAGGGGTSVVAGGAPGGGRGGHAGGLPAASGSGGAGSANASAGAGGSSGTAGTAGAGGGASGNAGAGGGAGTGNSSGTGGNAGANGGAGAGGDSSGGAASGSAGAGGGGQPVVGGVENGSADCPVPELAAPSALPQNSKLPDPFVKLDGTRLTKRSEWRCRRQEILEQAKKYVYGQKPAFDTVTGTVTQTKVTVHVEAMGEAIDFSADIVLPGTGQPPFPAIINVGAKGGFGGISLGESRILDQGVAVIYYDHGELGREGTPEASRGQPNPGKFYDIYGGNHSAGLLMAWAWGASRLIDVLQQSDGSIIAASKLGVTGCSRNGKGAFTIGVFDERIALTIPHETSTGGVPAYRIVDVLNTERTDHNYFGLNWLSNDFEPFVYRNGTSNAVKLPIDTHALIATLAPRGVLILENPHQTQMSAPAGHIAAQAGVEVFRALGIEANLSYHSNVAETPHCSYKAEYTQMLTQSIKKFLKGESAEPGRIDASTQGALRIADWKDWDAPALEADVTFD